MYTLMIVDADEQVRADLQQAAQAEGMQVFEVATGTQALAVVRRERIDIIVVDVTMKDMDGFAFCKQSCALKNIPILIHTAYGDEFIKLFAYNQLGISDYVVKPCSPQEVVARLKVILRHRGKSGRIVNDDVYRCEGVVVYKKARTLFVDEQKVELTPKEFDLLACLVAHENHVLSREQILQEVWGFDFFGSDRTVDTHVKRLRDHLGRYRDYIVTTHRVGYRFEPPAAEMGLGMKVPG